MQSNTLNITPPFKEVQGLSIFLLFLSPIFAPYLLNPNAVPPYSTSAFVVISFALFLLSSPPKVRTPILIIALLLIFTLLTIKNDTPIFVLALTAAVIMGGNLRSTALRPTYILFTSAIIIISTLSLIVWLGWTDSEPLHIGSWALTNDPLENKMNGPMTNGNVLAIIILTAWIAAFYLWNSSNSQYRWLWLIMLLIFWILIFSSLSRGTWIAQLFVLLWISLNLIRQRKWTNILIVAGCGFTAWASGDALARHNIPDMGGMQQQFESSSKGNAINARLTIWKSAWEMWKSAPFLGIGASQFKAHYMEAQARVLVQSPGSNGLRSTDSAHNILLHLMAEFGIAGLLLWLIISALIIRMAWLYRFKLDSQRSIAAAIAAALWIQGHINISLNQPYPLILFALMLGIGIKPLFHHTPSLMIPRKVLIGVSVVTFIFLLNGAIETTRKWSDFGDWMRMDISDPAKAKLAATLASDDEMFPYVVEFSIAEMAHIPEKQKQIGAMKPLILRALSLHQRKLLYRELFFAHLITKDLTAACDVGKFILVQNWSDESNQHAYREACQGKMPKRYNF